MKLLSSRQTGSKKEAWKKTHKKYKGTHPHPLIQRNDVEDYSITKLKNNSRKKQ
jgi:hypothetical protein